MTVDGERLLPGRSPSASACETYRERGWAVGALPERYGDLADLVTEHGFPAKYACVLRYVVKLRGSRPFEARGVIRTTTGEESQVANIEGPMVRAAATGKDRRRGLFMLTLGYSRAIIEVAARTPSGSPYRTRTW